MRTSTVLLLLRSVVALAIALATRGVRAAPSVWVIDDGEKIRRDATATPFERGEQNPVWRPGHPVRLFAMRNESVALQVVVEADDVRLDAVSVDLKELDATGGVKLASSLSPLDAMRLVGRPIERFVEHFVSPHRASGGRTPGEALGWEAGSGPPPSAWVGPVPDALVPIELAAPWAPYPMRIEPRTNGIVWIDLNIPADQPAGIYRGAIDARDGSRSLASIPVELTIADERLPDRPSRAMLYYDPDEIGRRVGAGAEAHLWKVLHAHRIAPMHDATEPDDVRRQRDALDGSLYTPANGYLGPSRGLGDGVLSLGAYGGLGDPNWTAIKALADSVAAEGLFGAASVFLYADDENCSSPRGAAWHALVAGSSDPNVGRVRVAWTCSKNPAGQPVDIPIVAAADYSADEVRTARGRGKEVWIYNGVMPHTGTFLLDADAVSPRVNGWLAEMFRVPRWFYWSSTYWYDRHGRTARDPFADAESFHNDDGDWANGDGVLLYPGRQVDAFSEHSLGFEGVIASVRLKNWRRGLEDAGYLELARARDAGRADAIARSLIPAAFHEVVRGQHAQWSPRGFAFFEARRALLAIALGAAPPKATHALGGEPGEPGASMPKLRAATLGGSAAAVLAIVAVAAAIVRRRRSPRSNGPA